MKATAVVAHPDDCVIFGLGFINQYRHFDWTVCYLTYNDTDPRGCEMAKFWHQRGVQTKFLKYPDLYKDLKQGRLSFDTVKATNDIELAIADQDLILTHNRDGEYEHPHHKFVHNVVAARHHCVVYFAANGGDTTYCVPPDVYSLDELPLHREVIAKIHSGIHCNQYSISDPIRNIL